MKFIKIIQAVVALFLEVCMLFGFGFWAYQFPGSNLARHALIFGLPTIAAVLWGIFAAPKSARRLRQPFLMLFKLTLFMSSAGLIYLTGHWQAALLFAIIVLLQQLAEYYSRRR